MSQETVFSGWHKDPPAGNVCCPPARWLPRSGREAGPGLRVWKSPAGMDQKLLFITSVPSPSTPGLGSLRHQLQGVELGRS